VKIGILVVGDELTRGMVQDANASYLAPILQEEGWEVSFIAASGDGGEDIATALRFLLSHSRAVIVTGGLGPTADDRTTESLARALGRGCFRDEEALRRIRERFNLLGLPWTENNAKQADFPDGAVPVPNPAGTAWGYILEEGGRTVAVLPGVPSEVRRMFPEGVLPLLRERLSGSGKGPPKRTLKLFGIGESRIDEILAGVDFARLGVSLGFYPRFPENQLVLTSRNADRAVAERNLEEAEEKVRGCLGKYIFARDEETLEGIVGTLLSGRKLTLAVAESCTGGLVADRLTDVPGSSAYFERALIVYSNASKEEMLRVPSALLAAHGAVSREAAGSMAEGVRALAGTDLGLSTTGIAGPGGGTDLKPVGTVFIAVAGNEGTVCREFRFRWNRRRVKEISAQWALEMLRRYLEGV
jgi:nicotinamide-nucleotide amidase